MLTRYHPAFADRSSGFRALPSQQLGPILDEGEASCSIGILVGNRDWEAAVFGHIEAARRNDIRRTEQRLSASVERAKPLPFTAAAQIVPSNAV
jgi:hypothetical protein